MIDIDDIRSRMHGLTEQARRTFALRRGASGTPSAWSLRQRRFLVGATTGLLDMADRAEAIGNRQGTPS